VRSRLCKEVFSDEVSWAIPTVRFIPRRAEHRYYYKSLERYFIGKQIQNFLSQFWCNALFFSGKEAVPDSVKESVCGFTRTGKSGLNKGLAKSI
jgi:hypothetical protein